MMLFMMMSMQSCQKEQATEENSATKAASKALLEDTANARRSSFKP
jgi:hypothetical protein